MTNTAVLAADVEAFTNRFSAAGKRKPTSPHPFDALCQDHGIEHSLIKPRRPKTNGIAERFNGRIAEILQITRFDSSRDLKQTLLNYRKVCIITSRSVLLAMSRPFRR